ncbi:MAG TPA: amino acid adenylation domain-containing protein, partial [Terriglobia bacterium]|nr:amino acid adenylation domain-containing protein [Terriglobia bacterium]
MTKANLDASYALSPMQEGMLFHSLYNPRSGVYVQQMVGELREELNVSAFRMAWQRLLERHGVLRTSFCLEGQERPLQTVHQFVQLPFEEHDWRELSGRAQEQGLEDYLEADRRQGFDCTRAPLLRVALFRWKAADYRLVWTSHHALLDGRSRLVLLEELFAFYEAAFHGGDIQLKASRPFKDYIDWLGKQDFNRSEDFWREMFQDAIMPTPIDIIKAQAGGTDTKEESRNQMVRLSRRRTLELRKLADEHQVTLNTLLQGAWALLLSRYSGKEEVVFGVTRACRKSALEGAESMVGILINTLPVRVQVSPDNLLLPWLQQLRAHWIAVREHEHTPLFRVQQWARADSGQPLFESLLVFENYELNDSLRTRSKSFRKRRFRLVGRTNYPLTIRGCLDRRLLLEITYDRQRFDDVTIARLLGQFETILEGIVSNPWRRICDMAILTREERHQLLVEWNNTKREYRKDRCFHQLFEEQVERTPEAVAVVFEGQRMTYRELNQRANQLARHLRKLGVGLEALVGICVERSLEMVIGLLGILKSGGAYVPLDPNYPAERLAFIVGDIQASVLLTQQSLARRLPKGGARVVCLDSDWDAIARQGRQNLVCRTLPEHLAYVMYTSGSTGTPKGVMIQHTSLINYLSWVNGSLAVGSMERIPLVSGLSFDAALKQLWAPLLRGSAIWILSQDTVTRPAALAQALRAQDHVGFNCVPSLWESIIAAVHSGQATIPAESVTGLLLGGERINKELIEKTLAKLPRVGIWNLYGPTETTANASAGRVSSAEDITIGRPIANTEIYLLDRVQNPVPIGAVGELYIGGVSLARGYHNRPELT